MGRALRPLGWYRSLANIEGRLEKGFFLVEGERAARQVMETGPSAVDELVGVSQDYRLGEYPFRRISEKQFTRIATSRTPQGIMAVVSLPLQTYSRQFPQNPGNKILLLEDVQDPGNIGTLVRTAAALGFGGIILSSGCADPFSPKCVQAAAGSVLSLWMRRSPDYLQMAEDLRRASYSLIATTPVGSTDTGILQAERLVLALGNEATGLSDRLMQISDEAFAIPIQRKRAESLNVAVSGGIIMYLASCGKM